jgi:hypothetical protein
MNSSRVLSLTALGIALLLTVPPKLSDYETLELTRDRALEEASTNLLARQGFEFKIKNHSGYFEINAQQDDCRLQIRDAAAQGYNVDEITTEVPKGSQLIFAYRGRLWTSHPTLRATISELWSRLKWQLALDNLWFPVISIAAVGHCATETLQLDRLATIRAN